jgi:hypothetical protein
MDAAEIAFPQSGPRLQSEDHKRYEDMREELGMI